MAKKTCECCQKPKDDLEVKEWGRRLLLCGTCRKQGRAKVLARLEAREPVPPAPEAEPTVAPASTSTREPASPSAPEPAQEPAVTEPSPEAPAATEPERSKRRKAKADGPKAPTVAGVVRELVARGKSNAEIWAVIQPRFGFSYDKKWYPRWYRWNNKRKAEAAEGGEP